MIGSAPSRGAFESSEARPGLGVDWPMIGVVGALIGTGIALLYSIDSSRAHSTFWIRQTIFLAAGIPLMLLLSRVRSERLQRASRILYAVNLVALTSVLFVGKSTNAATRWIDIGPLQFQPSELSKVLLIVTLSTFFAGQRDPRSLATFLASLAHVAPLAALVLLQPHLAGAASLFVIWFGVALGAGVRTRHMVATLLAVLAMGALAWKTPGLIRDYQKERIVAKFQPDAKGNAYQQQRAGIAFGVGGLTGVGYLKGEQKAARYIPEQQNDFIFTVVGEEGGLVGCAIVISLFALFFLRAWLVGFRSVDPVGRLVAAGVFSILGFHVFVNLGMNLGVLPVAGLWLPFISYGGTALWMCMACVGLLLGVK